MLTIALDETGQFDNPHDLLKLIGGLAYKANDSEAAEERLFQKIKQLCQQYKLNFPRSLHGNTIPFDTRQRLLHDLLQFLKQEKYYQLVGILKSPKPLSKDMSFSNLTQEIGNNLYESMSLRLLYNLLFYNPTFENKKNIALRIAKRSIEVQKGDEARIQLYEQFGYDSKYDAKNKKNIYYLTNSNTFKSALSTKLQELPQKRNLSCDIKAISIDYDTQDRLKQNAFLYAADLICSYFRSKLDAGYADFKITNLQKDLSKFKLPLMLFVYDDIDEQWVSLYKSYNEQNYFEILVGIYDFQQSSSSFAKLYNQSFVKEIDKNVDALFDIDRSPTYLSELEYYLEKRSNNSEYQLDKIIYVGEKIWSILQNYDKPAHQKYKYKLADILIRAYNHKGDVAKADDYYIQCQQLREFVSPIDYCATGLIVAQTSVNNFNFDSAFQEINDRIPLLLELKNAQMQIAIVLKQENTENKYPLLGKFYSSLGQFYTFTKQFDKAKATFAQALAEFEAARDIEFTSSLIIHLAMEMNDETYFKQHAKTVFKADSIHGYWEKTMENTSLFNVYAFLKAVNVFNWTLDEQLLNSIAAFIKSNTSNDHPWTLIYKHAAFVFSAHNQVDQGKQWIQKMSVVKQNRTTSDQIIEIVSELCYLHTYDSQSPKIEKLYNQLKQVSRKSQSIQTHFEQLFNEPLEQRGQSLNNFVCYIHA